MLNIPKTLFYKKSIVIVEPQCRGLVHASFNSQLLLFIGESFPQFQLIFFCDASHFREVKKLLPENFNVTHKKFYVPSDRVSVAGRISSELKNTGRLLINGRKDDVGFIFLSATFPTLGFTRILSMVTHRKILIFLHGVLEQAVSQEHVSELPIFSRWRLLTWRLPRSITIALLTEHIRRNITKIFPELASSSVVLEPPFLPAPDIIGEAIKEGTTFISAGVGSKKKGTDMFFELASRVSQVSSPFRGRFLFVGSLDQTMSDVSLKFVTTFIDDQMASSEKYEMVWRQADFIVLFYPEGAYKFTYSGVFLDALKSHKPIISTRNEFIEYAFKKFGKLGWICRSLEEVEELVISLADGERSGELAEIKQNFKAVDYDGIASRNRAVLLEFFEAP